MLLITMKPFGNKDLGKRRSLLIEGDKLSSLQS